MFDKVGHCVDDVEILPDNEAIDVWVTMDEGDGL
jgi:hypothetical protein